MTNPIVEYKNDRYPQIIVNLTNRVNVAEANRGILEAENRKLRRKLRDLNDAIDRLENERRGRNDSRR